MRTVTHKWPSIVLLFLDPIDSGSGIQRRAWRMRACVRTCACSVQCNFSRVCHVIIPVCRAHVSCDMIAHYFKHPCRFAPAPCAPYIQVQIMADAGFFRVSILRQLLTIKVYYHPLSGYQLRARCSVLQQAEEAVEDYEISIQHWNKGDNKTFRMYQCCDLLHMYRLTWARWT